jgi:hypothetical protein
VTACVGIQEAKQPVSDLAMAMKTALTESVLNKEETELNIF